MAKKTTQKLTTPIIKEPDKVITREDVVSLAKEKGYTGNESLYELQAWIRIKFGLHLEIFFSLFHGKFSINNYFIDIVKKKRIDWDYKAVNYESYDDALIVALYNILKLI